MRVDVRGDGIAACCCAHLLGSAGIDVAMTGVSRAKVPAILIGEATQALIRDVFQRDGLFEKAFRIERRVVAWGRDAKPSIFPHSAVVISEAELSCLLRPNLSGYSGNAGWTVLASPPLPSSIEHRFGSRIATAMQVDLKDARDSDACWIESLEDGWLFLIPTARESGWLLAVGGSPDLLIDKSSLIARRIVPDKASAHFPAYPRISDPLCGAGWLACGTAALAFDPLCGDGTGHAIREAILASAVLRAMAKGERSANLLDHYQARLGAAFARHLDLCKQFYEAGNSGAWWDTEIAFLKKHPNRTDGFRYRLRGFELEAVNTEQMPS